ncbi:MAG TPA: hypothetical protein VD789_11455 [Thermomicrobiales bacterium]|nr:hypothetical protein [Thermomicrobiales bacterium]
MSERRERSNTDTSAIRRYFRAAGQERSEPPDGRLWLLAVPVLACIPAIIAGSIGPWLHYENTGDSIGTSEMIMGWQTDGVFSLIFAVVAAATIVVAMVWTDREALAWVGFVALTLCAIVGLFDWIIFDPMELTTESADRVAIIRVEWGLKLLTFASLAGAVGSFLLARRLTQGNS